MVIDCLKIKLLLFLKFIVEKHFLSKICLLNIHKTTLEKLHLTPEGRRKQKKR